MTLVAIKNHFTIYSRTPLAICHPPSAICHLPFASHCTTSQINDFYVFTVRYQIASSSVTSSSQRRAFTAFSLWLLVIANSHLLSAISFISRLHKCTTLRLPQSRIYSTLSGSCNWVHGFLLKYDLYEVNRRLKLHDL